MPNFVSFMAWLDEYMYQSTMPRCLFKCSQQKHLEFPAFTGHPVSAR